MDTCVYIFLINNKFDTSSVLSVVFLHQNTKQVINGIIIPDLRERFWLFKKKGFSFLSQSADRYNTGKDIYIPKNDYVYCLFWTRTNDSYFSAFVSTFFAVIYFVIKSNKLRVFKIWILEKTLQIKRKMTSTSSKCIYFQ